MGIEASGILCWVSSITQSSEFSLSNALNEVTGKIKKGAIPENIDHTERLFTIDVVQFTYMVYNYDNNTVQLTAKTFPFIANPFPSK